MFTYLNYKISNYFVQPQDMKAEAYISIN